MSLLYLSANGARVTVARVSIPYYGAAVADIELPTALHLASQVALTIGNLTLNMFVLRQSAFAGSMSARLVGGAGGWGKVVALDPYSNAGGVKLSLVLRDVATRVGESVKVANDRSLGPFFIAERAPASRILRQIGGDLWWIDALGVTQVGPRSATRVKSAATVDDYDGATKWLRVATEDPAAWQPGARFTGPTVPLGVSVAATRIAAASDGSMRVEVLAA